MVYNKVSMVISGAIAKGGVLAGVRCVSSVQEVSQIARKCLWKMWFFVKKLKFSSSVANPNLFGNTLNSFRSTIECPFQCEFCLIFPQRFGWLSTSICCQHSSIPLSNKQPCNVRVEQSVSGRPLQKFFFAGSRSCFSCSRKIWRRCLRTNLPGPKRVGQAGRVSIRRHGRNANAKTGIIITQSVELLQTQSG